MTKEQEMEFRKILIRDYGIDPMLFTAYDNGILYSYNPMHFVQILNGIKLGAIEENDTCNLHDYLYLVLDKTIKMRCPREGEFIGYKKAKSPDYINCPVIVKLRIPEDAKRSSGIGNKCRCSKAFVEDVYYMEPNACLKQIYYAISDHDAAFRYEKGTFVNPSGFNENRFRECSEGIHFYMTEEEAKLHPLSTNILDIYAWQTLHPYGISLYAN